MLRWVRRPQDAALLRGSANAAGYTLDEWRLPSVDAVDAICGKVENKMWNLPSNC